MLSKKDEQKYIDYFTNEMKKIDQLTREINRLTDNVKRLRVDISDIKDENRFQRDILDDIDMKIFSISKKIN